MLREEAFREAQQVEMINVVLELRHQKRIVPKLADEIIDSLGGQ
jgi:hypothetical protein